MGCCQSDPDAIRPKTRSDPRHDLGFFQYPCSKPLSFGVKTAWNAWGGQGWLLTDERGALWCVCSTVTHIHMEAEQQERGKHVTNREHKAAAMHNL